MTHTAFFDLARQTAHAALNGSQQPTLGGKLLTHLKIVAKCFSGDETITVDEGTAEFLIMAKTSASGAASLIDTTAVLDESDADEPHYEFEWNPADSVQLRAVLDAAADPTAPVELRYEFRFERSGNKGCIGGPIYFLNNYFRPETPAPDATDDSSWTWLKEKVIAGSNLTRTVNDVTKVMTLSVPDFADGADGTDGREIELQVNSTHIQWRYVGEGSWTNLVALTNITGPAGTNGTVGADGTDGREIELQVNSTHIQWRYVGGTWTNLVALTTITGPAGEDAAAVSLVRGTGLLQGHTSAATASSSVFTWYGGASITSQGVLASLDLDGTTLGLAASDQDADPPYEAETNVIIVRQWASGSIGANWPELSSVISAINSAALSLGYAATMDSDGRLVLTASAAGSDTPPAALISGGAYLYSYGTPVTGADPAGAVTEVEIIAPDGIKAIKPLRVGTDGVGVDVAIEIALKVADDYYPIVTDLAANHTTAETVIGSLYAEWIAGRASAALVVRMAGAVPSGGSLNIWAIVEQN